MDGFNTHAGLVDELHAHPDSSIWDVIRSSMGARKQPLLRGITTSGFDRKSFAYNRRSYLIKVLQRVIEDDALFGIIFTVDDPEKWDDEEEWVKANPNLGVSVSLEDMREQCREAKELPTSKVEFLTKRLNIWTYGAVAWMPMDAWKKCRDESLSGVTVFDGGYAGEFAKCECYGGLDLSSVEDITSLSICFSIGNKTTLFQRSYLPQAALERRLKDGDKTFEQYRDSGNLIVTPGEVVDYSYIKKDVLIVCENFDLKGLAFDRWNSSKLVGELIDEGVPMVQFGQGFASMSAPMKEFLRLVLKKSLSYNDKLLTWAVSNLVAATNPAGDIKPDKSQVSEKIDPAVASIMGIALTIKPEEEDNDLSRHIEDSGIRSL